MERGNAKHSARNDDELKHELSGTLQGNRSSRSEEWRDPEPTADGNPDVSTAGPASRKS
ncbi:hypothetical protein I546_6771 [Mycobacterium kansasii 732]|uniref:Uncharacterized protein n=1 Tax=Mycobacterium pseudokansasii TaxID=2341080 RepID=A0A498QQQ9_9MYCO|nr:hypothetical protein [Mycobacterium pseudokansasii]ETZ99187.1 hypothetical protein I546_6771 [Mycobacterium kansasii 732]MBY0391325.1 hypothetical protein [Mycobacterium pseudokansasii]VAZ92544.1 hypothetical protein LAUMK35_02039 [Mycobacterium pseudokansasii]VAZ93638.1 hypothetical protein LAUMK21_02042 [Mycobacterium pseudokansasii]VBA49411.1 hypothetical protein LAUMK142_01922 [Mycobacterium pseudokansasii]